MNRKTEADENNDRELRSLLYGNQAVREIRHDLTANLRRIRPYEEIQITFKPHFDDWRKGESRLIDYLIKCQNPYSWQIGSSESVDRTRFEYVATKPQTYNGTVKVENIAQDDIPLKLVPPIYYNLLHFSNPMDTFLVKSTVPSGETLKVTVKNQGGVFSFEMVCSNPHFELII